MCRFVIFLAITATAVASNTYNIEQIKGYIDKGMECIEQYPVLTQNGAFHMIGVYGNANFTPIVKNMDKKNKKYMKKLQARLQKITQTSYEAYPEDKNRELYWSLYWTGLGDYSCKLGGIKKLPKLNKTVAEILEYNTPKMEHQKCYEKMMSDNPPSPTPRKCSLPCKKSMTSLKYTTDPSPMSKIYYFAYVLILNCTNYSPNEYREINNHLCSYTLMEVDTILRSKDHKNYEKAYAYLLDTVRFCAGYGTLEFLDSRILSSIVNRIDCNGCITNRKPTNETTQVLTADYLNILMIALRCSMEKEQTSSL